MKKSCLLVFKNKKINRFEDYDALIAKFASGNVYFDRILYCAYDDSQEIAKSIRESGQNYGNVVIFCPDEMTATLKNFAEKVFDNRFDNFGVMYAENSTVFVLSCGGKLTAEDIIEIISKSGGISFGKAYIKTVGAEAGEIDGAVNAAIAVCPDCAFNVFDDFSDCTIEIVYPTDISKPVFDQTFRALVSRLNEHIYAIEDISLAERLYQLLKLRRLKIAVAESFTGGGIAKKLVGVSGISEVYFEGLNVYSNEAKMLRLGVSEDTLRQDGAVSEQTAFEMAKGLLATGGCDIAVATTGIAGPKSDYTQKPVGLCYISVGTADGISVKKYELKGSREKITETAINLALFSVYKTIK